MIIYLKGANFSGEGNNIGTLDSWFIQQEFGSGVNYSGPTSVKKNAALNATITINSGYELNGSVSVTMGGSQVTYGVTTSGNTITISITSVTGNVVIKVPTKSTGGGGGGDTPSSTIWYINATNDETRTMEASSGGTGPYYYHKNSSYAGKTINAVRFKAPQAGDVEYGKVVSGAYTKIGNITVTNTNTFETYTIPDLILQSNEYIAFKGYFNYSAASDSPEATWFCDLGGHENKLNLGIDIGCVVGGGGTSEPTSTTWYLEAVDGFTLNATSDPNGSEKYAYKINTSYVGKPINAIKLNADTVGTFIYGIKDGSNYTEKGTATASSTGIVTLTIPEFTITGNQTFWIMTGTGAFKFGTNDPGNSALYFTGSGGSDNKMNLGVSIGYVV